LNPSIVSTSIAGIANACVGISFSQADGPYRKRLSRQIKHANAGHYCDRLKPFRVRAVRGNCNSFYGYNRPAAKITEGVSEAFWRQGKARASNVHERPLEPGRSAGACDCFVFEQRHR
jgi:hypothetical protein